MPLEVKHIAKKFSHAGGDVHLFHDLNFSIPDGGSVALVGPSGSGKTTLLRLIAALEQPSAGRIVVNGQDVVALRSEDARCYRRRTIGFVYQEHRLLPQLTALENVLLPTLAEKTLHRASDYRDEARRLLAEVGMSPRETFFPDEMSGGERQRVALARALILRPSLLLADEPTGQLDAARAEQLLALFQQINRVEGVIIVMATHSRQAMAYMQEQVVLREEEGRK